MATCKESLKRTSGSVVLPVSRAEMLEKHEAGYRVTLQTALSEVAGVSSGRGTGLDDELLFRLCTATPMTAPMITAKRTMEETATMIKRLHVFRRKACCSTSSTLPYPLKELIESIDSVEDSDLNYQNKILCK